MHAPSCTGALNRDHQGNFHFWLLPLNELLLVYHSNWSFDYFEVGIVFDIIGIAVTVAEEEELHAKASKKIEGAKKGCLPYFHQSWI